MSSPSKDVDPATDLSIRRLIARYSHLVDDGDMKAAAELFSDNGRFNAMGEDLRGRQAIEAWLGTTPGDMWHEVTNVVVSNGSHEGTYHAVSDLALHLKGEGGAWKLAFVGRYHDTLTGGGRDMHFTQRILTVR